MSNVNHQVNQKVNQSDRERSIQKRFACYSVQLDQIRFKLIVNIMNSPKRALLK